ncbi:hypothetical protein B0T22DRAFT_35788 [Podospora appendiculata]|uniref:Uncharacterized protein n=1 Tax=Podospora appendiculata TaxID=314037 RepID=A0AAE0XHA7_9PEZI|nr:hypothetical protein B0T22DRAFT_35788 [Podospora appendiculata]
MSISYKRRTNECKQQARLHHTTQLHLLLLLRQTSAMPPSNSFLAARLAIAVPVQASRRFPLFAARDANCCPCTPPSPSPPTVTVTVADPPSTQIFTELHTHISTQTQTVTVTAPHSRLPSPGSPWGNHDPQIQTQIITVTAPDPPIISIQTVTVVQVPRRAQR